MSKSKPFIIGVIAFVVFAAAGIGVAEVMKSQGQKTESIENEPLQTVEAGGDDLEEMSDDDSAIRTGPQVRTESDDDSEEGEIDDDDDTPSGGSSASQGAPQQTLQTFTLAQVAIHNSAQSCYTAINGSVYDVTAWISQHPGGVDAILSLCGKDGTAAFTTQHSGQPRPANELSSFKIGTLVQ